MSSCHYVFFKSDLRAHFDIKEMLTADHDAMQAMIHGLHADLASALDERLQAFDDLLTVHIIREEQHLPHQTPKLLHRLQRAGTRAYRPATPLKGLQ